MTETNGKIRFYFTNNRQADKAKVKKEERKVSNNLSLQNKKGKIMYCRPLFISANARTALRRFCRLHE